MPCIHSEDENICLLCFQLLNTCPSTINNPPPPYQPQLCPAPPYNAPSNPNFSTYAQRNPNFPLNTGSNYSQVVSNNANNTIYEHINQKNAAIKAANSTQPYVMFKSQQERIAYTQAQIAAQSRQQAMRFMPPAFPTPTQCQVCNGLFNIINNQPHC
jgi:hypothetical protein